MSLRSKLFLFLMALAIAVYVINLQILKPDHHAHEEDRVQHYEAETAATVDEAKAILARKTAAIGTLLGNQAISNQQLEAIHEHSYSLEAAVDKLRAENAASEEKIDTLDEAVQALHYASENHEEAQTREWFGRMQAAINAL